MKNIIPALFSSSRNGLKFSPHQRLEIGLALKFARCENASDIVTAEYGCSRAYAYECRDQASEFLDRLNDSLLTNSLFLLDKDMIKSMVVALSCACKASNEGIMNFFQMIFECYLCIGLISQYITEAGKSAIKVNEGISCSTVTQAGADEIYMDRDQPIKTVVDLESTYTCMVEPAEKLNADVWKDAMIQLAETNGFKPEVMIVDGGNSLNKGIPAALNSVYMQSDVFHNMMNYGREYYKLQRYAESRISEEAKYDKAVAGKKIHKKTLEKRENVKEELKLLLPIMDEAEKHYNAIHKLFGFCGLSYDDAQTQLKEHITEMLEIIPSAKSKKDSDPYSDKCWKRFRTLRAALHKLAEKIDDHSALGFLSRFETKLSELTDEYDIDQQIVLDMYGLYKYIGKQKEQKKQEDNLFARLYEIGKEDLFDELLVRIRELVQHTCRASSLVENVNQKIRPYINARRSLSREVCALIQLYINTKKYRRSINGRKGKSPLELMSGQTHPPFLELLGLW